MDVGQCKIYPDLMRTKPDVYIPENQNPIIYLLLEALDNSLYEASKGRCYNIDIRISPSDEMSFVVSDDGPGISHECIEEFITKFQKSPKRDIGMNGIGFKYLSAYSTDFECRSICRGTQSIVTTYKGRDFRKITSENNSDLIPGTIIRYKPDLDLLGRVNLLKTKADYTKPIQKFIREKYPDLSSDVNLTLSWIEVTKFNFIEE